MLSLLLSPLLSCRRCSLVVAPASVVGAAPVAAPVVAAAPGDDPIAAPVSASVADPVADSASPLRVRWTFGILGSMGMPFRRGRHLRHTPGRMRFSVPGSRIRPRRVYLQVAFATRLQTPACIRSAGSMADQRFYRRISLTPGDTQCIRPSAWIRILLTFPGCPCLVLLLGLSSRVGYPRFTRSHLVLTVRNRQGVCQADPSLSL